MTVSLEALRAKPHLSASRIKSFLSCPRKHWLQYIERKQPAFRPVALAFGIAFHEGLAAHFTRSTSAAPVPIDEVHAAFRDALERQLKTTSPPVLFDDDENAASLVDKGVAMLDVFIERVPMPERVLGVEVPFSLRVTDRATGEVCPVPIVGAIDAIVEVEKRTAVWEFKSGKRKWTNEQIEFDLQSTVYRMAARAMGLGHVALTLLVTTKTKRPDVQVEELVRHARDEDEVVEAAFACLRAADRGVTHRVRSWACKACPYSWACE